MVHYKFFYSFLHLIYGFSLLGHCCFNHSLFHLLKEISLFPRNFRRIERQRFLFLARTGGGGALPFRRQISAPPLGARAVAVEPEATIPERSIPERLIPSSDADSTLNCPARHRPRPPSSRRQPSRAHRRSMALDSVDSSSAVRVRFFLFISPSFPF